MKIAVAHNQYRIRGGEDVVVERECALLESAGHQVIRYFRSSHEIEGSAQAARVAWNLPYSRSEKEKFRSFLEAERPELVHVHNTFPLLTPSILEACREKGVPAVATLHNYRLFCANALFLRDGKNCELCLEKGSAWPAVKFACYQGSRLKTLPMARLIERSRREQIWQKNVNAFICVTDFAKGKFREGGLPAERIHVKRHFSPDLLQEHTREPGSFALYLGRLSPEKGIETLLRAWEGPKEQLRFVGDGELAPRIREVGHQVYAGLSGKEVFSLLARCQFLVMPSECYESAIPLVLLEALSLRVPVVTSRFAAAGEVFNDGQNAWIFSPGNVAELRAAMRDCMSNPGKQAKIAEAGRRTFEEHFTAESNLRRLLEIYATAKSARLAD